MSETYPKMLYRGGQAYDPETGKGVAHQHTLTVNDAAEEEAAAADGFSPAEMPEAPEEEPASAEEILADDPNTAAVVDAPEPEAEPVADPVDEQPPADAASV